MGVSPVAEGIRHESIGEKGPTAAEQGVAAADAAAGIQE
jgi:hypothetical protein